MKKRMLGLLMVLVLVLAQMMPVSAEPSKNGDFKVNTDGYEMNDSDKEMPKLPDGKKPITGVKDLESENNGGGKVEFEVPNLTKDMLDGLGIYYTVTGDEWFFLEASSVDLENQTVTFDLPEGNITFVLVCNEQSLTDEAVGTAPKTGVTSTWMAWILAAMALAAVAVILGKKKTA